MHPHLPIHSHLPTTHLPTTYSKLVAEVCPSLVVYLCASSGAAWAASRGESSCRGFSGGGGGVVSRLSHLLSCPQAPPDPAIRDSLLTRMIGDLGVHYALIWSPLTCTPLATQPA